MFTKNVAVTGFTFGLVNATDGSAVTSGTPTELITKDGGAQAAMTNNAVHEGNGQWSIDITNTEMNADVVGLLFTHADAIPVQITIKTTTLAPPSDGILDVNTIEVSGDASAADNMEAAFENAGSNTVTMRLASLSIINSGGDALIAQSTGSGGSGALIQGNGAGPGLEVLGGASGVAALFRGSGGTTGEVHLGDTTHGALFQGTGAGEGAIFRGGTSTGTSGIRAESLASGGAGHGVRAIGVRGGHGIFGDGGQTAPDTGHGAFFKGALSDGHGMRIESTFTGRHGLVVEGVGVGAGVQFKGGASNGPGARFDAGGGNAPGAIFQGLGTGDGMEIQGGVSGAANGLRAQANSASGHGIFGIGAGTGDGMQLFSGSGVGAAGLRATGALANPGYGARFQAGGTGDAIFASVAGGLPLSQNIEDQLAGAPWDVNLASHQGAGTSGLYLTQAAKILRNRMKIDAALFTMTIYDDDGTTPLLVWDVKDSAGNPSTSPIFEREPV